MSCTGTVLESKDAKTTGTGKKRVEEVDLQGATGSSSSKPKDHRWLDIVSETRLVLSFSHVWPVSLSRLMLNIRRQWS